MVRKPFAQISAVFLLACGPRSGPHDPATAPARGGDNFDAKAELAREAQGLSERPFKGPKLSFKAPASDAPTLTEEKGVVIASIPIGEGDPVKCYLYESDPDTGGTLLHLLGALKKAAQIRELSPEALEVVREAPVVRLSAVYSVEQEGGLALGQLKLAFHARYNHSSLCVHDQLGFSKTFREVSTAYFGSLEAGREDLTPSYAEVSAATLGETPVGYDRVMIFREGKDERRITAGFLMLLRSPTDLVTIDSVAGVVMNTEGRIESGEWYNAESGTPDLRVSLKLSKAGAYHYEGTFKGKPLQGDFTHSDKRGLPGPRLVEDELKKRLKKPGAFSLAHTSYHPGHDPTRPTEETYGRIAGDPGNRVRLKQGDMEVIGTVDAEGRMEDGQMTLGRMQLRLKRAFVRGKP